MAKRQSRTIKRQKIALGAFGILVLGIVAFLFWQTAEDIPGGEFVEGEHYFLVEEPRRIRSEEIEIMEFFSYGCVHCYNFDPILIEWVESKGDSINFVRTPAIANEYWRVLGRIYYTLESMGHLEEQHMPLFRTIHDARVVFTTNDDVFDYFEDAGLDREAFINIYSSANVNSSLNRADQMARRLRIASVPTMIVHGKYLVRASGSVGMRRMLDVMDFLIEKERTPGETAEAGS